MNAPRTPPRFVPTLTEVIDQPAPVPSGYAQQAPAIGQPTAPGFTPQMQQALVDRVLQRVDQTLALRLREALAASALEQSQAIAQRMRAEIENVVGELVAQAVAAELAARGGSGGTMPGTY